MCSSDLTIQGVTVAVESDDREAVGQQALSDSAPDPDRRAGDDGRGRVRRSRTRPSVHRSHRHSGGISLYTRSKELPFTRRITMKNRSPSAAGPIVHVSSFGMSAFVPSWS